VTSNDALGRLDVLSSTGNGTVAFALNDLWANSKQDTLTGVSTNGGVVEIANTAFTQLRIIANSPAWPGIDFVTYDGNIAGKFFAESTGNSTTMRFRSTGKNMNFQTLDNGTYRSFTLSGAVMNWPGSFTATSKSFVIPHLDTSKVADDGKEWKLIHHCIESDHPYLQYRETIAMTNTTQTIQMPVTWFPHLVSDVCVHMSPFQHFGSGWGQLQDDGCSLELHVTTLGTWHVLVTGIRKDPCGLECRAMPTEYQEDSPQYTS